MGYNCGENYSQFISKKGYFSANYFMAKLISKPSKGMVLVAEPFMKDSYFKRSVVLLADHGEKGSMGFMLNKTIEIKLNDAIPDFPQFDGSLHLGGPVSTDQLFFIHRYGELIPKSIEIMDGLWWGGDFIKLRSLMKKDEIDITQLRFFVGYAGWDPEQLNKELNEKSWIITKQKINTILNGDWENLWPNILKRMGGEFTLMANFPEDPSLN